MNSAACLSGTGFAAPAGHGKERPFEPISTQMEKKCLENVWGTKNNIRPLNVFLIRFIPTQKQISSGDILLFITPGLQALLYAYCIHAPKASRKIRAHVQIFLIPIYLLYTRPIYGLIISKFYGTSTPKGSYSAKTGESTRYITESTRKKWYGSTVWELRCLRTALCEGIHYQAKSEQNVRQDLIPKVRHGGGCSLHPFSGLDSRKKWLHISDGLRNWMI